MNRIARGLGLAMLITLALLMLAAALTPWGRTVYNRYAERMQVVENQTSYAVKKQVEDTARAMIASYRSDAVYYAQYSASGSEKEREWAEIARARANKTAIEYNEYVRKNRRVWPGNIPPDIDSELPMVGVGHE